MKERTDFRNMKKGVKKMQKSGDSNVKDTLRKYFLYLDDNLGILHSVIKRDLEINKGKIYIFVILFHLFLDNHYFFKTSNYCLEMESYKLQKRIVLSFETGKYEDGETDYTYIVDVFDLYLFYNPIEIVMKINRYQFLPCLQALFELLRQVIIQMLQRLI